MSLLGTSANFGFRNSLSKFHDNSAVLRLRTMDLDSQLVLVHGFIAKPETKSNGSVNLMCWKCFVPGKDGTDWEGGRYPLTLQFNENYPTRPPKCRFPSGFLHPNVFSNGEVCLSILNAGWKPSISVKQILLGIQDLLVQPNPGDAANSAANQIFVKDPDEYKRRVQLQSKQYPPVV